jgi:hypothetical protein
MSRLVAFTLLLLTSGLDAQAADVDWKVYGFATVEVASVCFYDARSVVSLPGRQQDIDRVDIKHDFGGKIVENAARKVVNHYIPPIAAVEESIDFDKAITIGGYEEVANIADIEPHATMLYELDCSQRMMRQLSISMWLKGQFTSDATPGAWEFNPPESNGTRLMRILCGPS